MNADKSQIVVYQPNETVRLDVRFDNETVWMPQPQIAELSACSLENVRLHLKNIYASGELDKLATSKESLEVRREGNRSVTRRFTYDMFAKCWRGVKIELVTHSNGELAFKSRG
jgi:hypothetical protein